MVKPLQQDSLSYATKGWYVLPVHSPVNRRCSCGRKDCPSPAKHPRSPHGFLDATNDVGAVRQWWSSWPDANIGIRTGQTFGIVVLDLDAVHGGPDWWLEAQDRHGRTDTLEAVTGGGGAHIYFCAPREPLRSTAGVIAPGVDTRAEGGYVVAPPSRHISGHSYRWITSGLPPAPIPGWLLALWPKFGVPSQTANPTAGGSAKMGAAIKVGHRNSILASIAGLLRSRGLGQDAISAALLAHNFEVCAPPLSEEEVRNIASSVARYPAGNDTRTRSQQGPFKRGGRVFVTRVEVSL